MGPSTNSHFLAHFGGSGAEVGPVQGFGGWIWVHFGSLGAGFGRLDLAHCGGPGLDLSPFWRV